MNPPFYFYTQSHLVKLLGLKARNPRELLEGLKTVPLSSIYYHTHRFLQQHHYLSPEPPNDFAYWITNILNMRSLGEAFASVDIIRFTGMEKLKEEFVKILTEYISREKYAVDCHEGQEFHFMSCVSVICPTPYVAHDLKEFSDVLSQVSISSIYFHMFEARMRLKKDENDFAAWFRGLGAGDLAVKISKLDPYTMTLEGLRQKIIQMMRPYLSSPQ